MSKKLMLLLSILSFLLFPINSGVKQFEHNFLGPEFKFYIGSCLMIDTLAQAGFTYSFYDDIEYTRFPDDTNVVFPDRAQKFTTLRDSLLHRVFMVKEIINKNPDDISSVCLEKPVFILWDTTAHRTLYFMYDCENEANFPFLVMQGLLNESNLCSLIERNIDEYSGNTKLNTPLEEGTSLTDVILYKEIGEKRTDYTLSLTTTGSKVRVNGVGVGVLFTDGTGFSKKVQVFFRPDLDHFHYNAIIPMTKADLDLLSTKTIKKFRLYIFDANLDRRKAERFRIYVRCLRKAK